MQRHLLNLFLLSLTLIELAFAKVPSRKVVNKSQYIKNVHVENMDPSFIPTSDNGKRLIFIGDIHGQLNEFVNLLEAVNYDQSSDHVVLVGDLVSKGPASLDVLYFAKYTLNASMVIGNHDDSLARWHAYIDSHQSRYFNQYVDLKSVPSEFRISEEEHALASHLNSSHLDVLYSMATMLRVGNIPDFGETVVVHAGLMPDIALEEQDHWTCIEIRNIYKGSPYRKHKRGSSWFKAWNEAQRKKEPEDRVKVIYGHDAKRGLRIEEYTKGLDTACVHGRQLTAFILPGETVVSVNCTRFD